MAEVLADSSLRQGNGTAFPGKLDKCSFLVYNICMDKYNERQSRRVRTNLSLGRRTRELIEELADRHDTTLSGVVEVAVTELYRKESPETGGWLNPWLVPGCAWIFDEGGNGQKEKGALDV